MTCQIQHLCGGCSFRNMAWEEYKQRKINSVKKILEGLSEADYVFAEPFFAGDGVRRRAAFAYEYKKGKLTLGFNQAQSENIIDFSACPLLSPRLNNNLENIRALVAELCVVQPPILHKKGKKQNFGSFLKGDILVCEADNGLDIVLEADGELSLDHRMIISEMAMRYPDFIRVSHRRKEFAEPETILEKVRPYIDIAGYAVYIPAGTFLQASKASEQALIDIVMRYVGESSGKIADLFCGVGTFSYPLSRNKSNKIVAVDSSKSLLNGFRCSVNKNMIPNIEIIEKNLFKYPLDEKELNGFDVVVFDPPRAGAQVQAQKLTALKPENRPEKIIAVSCNPHSFVKDANILTSAGYKLRDITLVDQFTYSNHSELVALFTK